MLFRSVVDGLVHPELGLVARLDEVVIIHVQPGLLENRARRIRRTDLDLDVTPRTAADQVNCLIAIHRCSLLLSRVVGCSLSSSEGRKTGVQAYPLAAGFEVDRFENEATRAAVVALAALGNLSEVELDHQRVAVLVHVRSGDDPMHVLVLLFEERVKRVLFSHSFFAPFSRLLAAFYGALCGQDAAVRYGKKGVGNFPGLCSVFHRDGVLDAMAVAVGDLSPEVDCEVPVIVRVVVGGSRDAFEAGAEREIAQRRLWVVPPEGSVEEWVSLIARAVPRREWSMETDRVLEVVPDDIVEVVEVLREQPVLESADAFALLDAERPGRAPLVVVLLVVREGVCDRELCREDFEVEGLAVLARSTLQRDVHEAVLFEFALPVEVETAAWRRVMARLWCHEDSREWGER